jgi:hypothetical protein
LDADNPDPYTDWYHLKFSKISEARQAKMKLNKSPFYGNLLNVSFCTHKRQGAMRRERSKREREVQGGSWEGARREEISSEVIIILEFLRVSRRAEFCNSIFLKSSR